MCSHCCRCAKITIILQVHLNKSIILQVHLNLSIWAEMLAVESFHPVSKIQEDLSMLGHALMTLFPDLTLENKRLLESLKVSYYFIVITFLRICLIQQYKMMSVRHFFR